MMFDPYKTRFRAFEPAMLRFYLGTEYDADAPMGNVAIQRVSDVIYGWLVGLHGEVAPILPKAIGWLDQAIREGEDFGVDLDGHRSRLCAARALAGWLQDGSACQAMWNEAAISQRASWLSCAHVWPNSAIVYWALAPTMAYLLLAGDAFDGPATAIALYEQHTGRNKPPSVKTLRSPLGLAYALALQATGRQRYEPQALAAAGRRVLSINLEEKWLGQGQVSEAALWLKLTYAQHQPPLTPLQTILKAYDNMPQVPWPDFMPRQSASSEA